MVNITSQMQVSRLIYIEGDGAATCCYIYVYGSTLYWCNSEIIFLVNCTRFRMAPLHKDSQNCQHISYDYYYELNQNSEFLSTRDKAAQLRHIQTKGALDWTVFRLGSRSMWFLSLNLGAILLFSSAFTMGICYYSSELQTRRSHIAMNRSSLLARQANTSIRSYSIPFKMDLSPIDALNM